MISYVKNSRYYNNIKYELILNPGCIFLILHFLKTKDQRNMTENKELD